MRALISSSVLLLIVFQTAAYAELIRNPEDHFRKQIRSSELIYRLEGDFNNDALTDYAFAESQDFGRSGGPWTIYLKNENASYEIILETFFHPLAFLVRPTEEKKSRFITFLKESKNKGVIVEHLFEGNTLTEQKRNRVDMSHSQAKELYDVYFGELAQNPIHQSCAVDEFKLQKCSWNESSVSP